MRKFPANSWKLRENDLFVKPLHYKGEREFGEGGAKKTTRGKILSLRLYLSEGILGIHSKREGGETNWPL